MYVLFVCMYVCMYVFFVIYVDRRSRFDRIWFWRGEKCPFKLEDFKFVGTQKIDAEILPMHPSDHFGLMSRFIFHTKKKDDPSIS